MYKDVTSKEAKMQSSGTRMDSILLMKSVVSLIYDGIVGTMCFIFSSTNAEMRSVGDPFALIMGLPGGNSPGFLIL